MGIRSRLRALSSSGGRSPSPQPSSQTPAHPPPPPPPPQVFGPLPANLSEPIILTISSPAPSITILTQAIDFKPVFQIDESTAFFVTHIPSNQPVGSVTIGADNNITVNHPSTTTVITYRDDLKPPPWFKSLNGNTLYWHLPACNEWQGTLHLEIVDGINHPNDEDDLAVVVILDSKLKKGRIEIRKQMTKDEMDFLLLSAWAEIVDLRRKIDNMVAQAATAPTNASVRAGGGRGKVSAGQYLSVANNMLHVANQAAHAGGYAGDSGGYGGDSGGGFSGDSGGGEEEEVVVVMGAVEEEVVRH